MYQYTVALVKKNPASWVIRFIIVVDSSSLMITVNLFLKKKFMHFHYITNLAKPKYKILKGHYMTNIVMAWHKDPLLGDL